MSTWNTLTTEAQLQELRKASHNHPQLIFKHSVRCGTSAHVKYYLEDATADLNGQMDLHYLDLIRFRSISNEIASEFAVPHQSPQILLIKDGKAVYNASHLSINPARILEHAAEKTS